ncbi:MAG: response regulator transcription factor [Bryobacterales bacterium]|nr:response regulator transcription factor [Bryobacterales bacterium]
MSGDVLQSCQSGIRAIVVLLDHCHLFVEGARQVLMRRVPKVAVAESEADLCQELVSPHPVVVLTDRNWLKVLASLHPSPIRSGVRFILAVTTEDLVAIRIGLRLRVNGFLDRDTGPEELVRAVSEVAAGHNHFSAGLSSLISRAAVCRQNAAPCHLTNRQMQIAGMICDGMTSEAIARQLSISARTVDFHRARIYRKLGIRSSAQLAQSLLLTDNLAPTCILGS